MAHSRSRSSLLLLPLLTPPALSRRWFRLRLTRGEFLYRKRNTRQLITRLARENAGWGYRRIIGELRRLRIKIGRTSVQRILKEEGLLPSPTRGGRAGEKSWHKFIRLQVDTLVACDFFTKKVVTPFGTRLVFYLAFIHVGARKVYLSPVTYEPNERWGMQQVRKMIM